VSIIHRTTTLAPSKLELLAAWLPTRTWYRVTGRAPELAKAGGFRLDDPEGEVGIEFMMAVDASGGDPVSYHVPMTYRGRPLDGAGDALIGTAEHGVLGKRWVYDGTRDPVLVAALVALIQGEAEPQAQSESHTPDPTVRSHPASDLLLTPSAFTVADGLDQSELLVSVGTAGKLALSVSRVLRPAPGEAFSGAVGGGYVTATWRPGGGEAVRGIVATAQLR
jgi:hypothetical protein